MKGIKQFESWRAEEIAKVYLLNSGLVDLLPNKTDKFDFIAISKDSPDKKIAIEVKATKYPKGDLKRVFSKTRKKFSDITLPVMLMYIDSDKENGYFEILKNKIDTSSELQILQSDKLEEQLTKLIV